MNKDVYTLGDIHGDFGVIANWIINNNLTNIILIQVGDFGIGFINNPSVLVQLDKLLRDTNNELVVIRGNHDNPSCFSLNNNVNVSLFDRKGEIDSSDIEHAIRNFTNIKLVPDYTVIDVNGEKWLLVGGAISIDRMSRNLGQSYWIDEKFNYNEDLITSFENITRVITHSCPDFCPPVKLTTIVYSFAKYDMTLLADLKEERELLTKMFSKLKEKNEIKSWVFGHMHRSSNIYHGSTEFIGLDINEFKQILGKDDELHI